MRLFDFIAILTVLAAGFSYINFRFLKLPATIGLMALALVFSLAIVLAGALVPEVERQARVLVAQFVAMTYVVVVFSILVQGLTIAPLTRRWLSPGTAWPSPSNTSPSTKVQP
jgi:NhaP-type Na+/H+ or K+/H+ antiporter